MKSQVKKQNFRELIESIRSTFLRSFLLKSFCLQILLLTLVGMPSAGAEEFREGFDGGEASCKAFYDPKSIKLKLQERNHSLAFSGQSAERFQFVSSRQSVPVMIECKIKPTRIFDDLSISISVSSNRPGTQLIARVVFPGQLDPKTDLPLTRLISGDVLEKPTSWKKLTCETTDTIIAQHLALWRASIKPQKLDHREMYIDRIYLKQTLGQGMTEILIDDLRVSPIVTPSRLETISTVSGSSELQGPLVEFQLDQLKVNQHPFFPVIIPYQHEPISLFEKLGVNVVWIDDYRNTNLLRELNSKGIWATAWPPSAKTKSGDILDAGSASLLPFGKETGGILFWNLGVRIEPETHQQLQHWVSQVKASDGKLKRPIFADVVSGEPLFSRDLEMLGISKHVIQTPYSFAQYGEHLQQRKRRAQPGTFMMTWLQTEPSHVMAEYREALQYSPAVVEPEQIRLQTYTALCAGCKGIGYWNWTPLNAKGPGLEERRLVLEELMQELELLEPFLAGGEVVHRFDVPLSRSSEKSSKEPGNDPSEKKKKQTAEKATAAVIRSEHGQVILLSAQDENAQFVPGQMAGNDVRIRVRGLPESAFLWEITTTGLWPLDTKRVTGYTEIRLPRFNMTAALMVATDRDIAKRMEEKIRQTQSRNAELALLLAEEKYKRVVDINQQLVDLGAGLPEATHILSEARRKIDESRFAWKNRQHDQTRRNAKIATQLLRILQRGHWAHAVQSTSSPTSVPHTVCFQTLPDYWKLVQGLGTGEIEEVSLLRSGQFEDRDAMFVEGWTRDVSTSEEIVVYDALDPSNTHEGEYCLRAASIPAQGKQAVSLDKPAITYKSPSFSLKPGDLLHVSGWVRIPRPIEQSIDGFRIYDSHFGSATCLQWSEKSDWQSFELIRPIWKQEEIRIIFELNGLGDVAIDDLKIKAIRLNEAGILRQVQNEEKGNPSGETKSRSTALEFLNRLLK